MARAFSANYHQLTRAFAVPHSWQFTLSVAFVAQVFSAVGYSMMFPFLPLHIETLGTTTGLSTELAAGLVISVQGLTMMVTAPFWGVAADRFGRKRMIMRAMFGGAITMAMMGFAQTAEQLIIIRAMQGLVTGTVSANNALVAAATPRHRVGFAMGALQLGLWAGVAVGPLIGGILADHFGYNIPYLVTGVLLMSKGMDTFAPLGPCIATDLDPSNLEIMARLNGEVKQHSNTDDLLFNVASLVAYTSQGVTLNPGDCIYTGTCAGPSALSPGDVIEIEVEGVGVLSNPVVAA